MGHWQSMGVQHLCWSQALLSPPVPTWLTVLQRYWWPAFLQFILFSMVPSAYTLHTLAVSCTPSRPDIPSHQCAHFGMLVVFSIPTVQWDTKTRPIEDTFSYLAIFSSPPEHQCAHMGPLVVFGRFSTNRTPPTYPNEHVSGVWLLVLNSNTSL